MEHKKRLLKITSRALTLTIACSCGAAAEKQTQAPALPKTESLPAYSESAETTFYSETIETTAPEISAEISSVSSDSEEPDPIETQDDFSDIIELFPSTIEEQMERFDRIAERAFHTEIKNDMEMEEIISYLMDRYIICTNTYDVRTLFDWDFDEQFKYLDHTYYKMQHRYFNTLSEMEDFVKKTFTHEKAEIWISTSSSEPGSNTYVPRFIQKEDGIYFCVPDYVFIPPPSFLDNHIIEIKECGETECVFSYNANIDPKGYNQMIEAEGGITWSESDFFHEGKIVLEDGEWKIDYISPAAF